MGWILDLDWLDFGFKLVGVGLVGLGWHGANWVFGEYLLGFFSLLLIWVFGSSGILVGSGGD